MNDKVILKKQLLELRMQIMFAKDVIEKEKLEEQVDVVRNTYSKILFEEKFNQCKKGR